MDVVPVQGEGVPTLKNLGRTVIDTLPPSAVLILPLQNNRLLRYYKTHPDDISGITYLTIERHVIHQIKAEYYRYHVVLNTINIQEE